MRGKQIMQAKGIEKNGKKMQRLQILERRLRIQELQIK